MIASKLNLTSYRGLLTLYIFTYIYIYIYITLAGYWYSIDVFLFINTQREEIRSGLIANRHLVVVNDQSSAVKTLKECRTLRPKIILLEKIQIVNFRSKDIWSCLLSQVSQMSCVVFFRNYDSFLNPTTTYSVFIDLNIFIKTNMR